MNGNKLIALIGTLLLCSSIISCDRPVSSFERSNVSDPVHQNFKTGSASELKISFDEEGIIYINWQDSAYFEDGFIIEKSLGDSLSFKEIGRAKENATVFHDSSGVVQIGTFYRVTAYIEKEDKIEKSEPVTKKMEDFGTLTEFKIEFVQSTNSINIQWASNTPFAKKYRLLYKKDANEDAYTLIGEFDASSNKYIDDLSDISFKNREYKIILFLMGENYQQTLAESIKTFDRSIFDPSNFSIEVLDETTINVSWKDNSFFEDGYKVFYNGGEIADLPPDSKQYQHNISLSTHKLYKYGIKAYTSNSETSIIEKSKFYSIPTPYLIYDRQENTQVESINISWDIKNDQYVKQYIVERRSSMGEDWAEIKRFDKSTKNYTDINVDPQTGYAYRIRTLSSIYSSELQLKYANLFNQIAVFNAAPYRAYTVTFSPDGNYIAAISDHTDYTNPINIYNIADKQLSLTISDNTASYSDVSFNAEGTVLAGAIDHSVGEITLHEFPSGNLIKRINTVGPDRVRISPNYNFLYISTSTANIRKIDIITEEVIFEYEGRTSPYIWKTNISLSPNGELITINDKTPTVISTSDGSIIKDLTSYPDYRSPYFNNPSFSYDGTKVAILFDKRLQVYDTSSWQKLYESGKGGRFHPHFDPYDSNMLVGVTGLNVIHFRNITSPIFENKITTTGERIMSLDYSNDGKRVAVGFEDGTVEIWEITNTKVWKLVN